MFNGLLCHYILMREVEEDMSNTISFKLLGRKVSYGHEQFNIVTKLRYKSKLVVEFNWDKALGLEGCRISPTRLT